MGVVWNNVKYVFIIQQAKLGLINPLHQFEVEGPTPIRKHYNFKEKLE